MVFAVTEITIAQNSEKNYRIPKARKKYSANYRCPKIRKGGGGGGAGLVQYTQRLTASQRVGKRLKGEDGDDPLPHFIQPLHNFPYFRKGKGHWRQRGSGNGDIGGGALATQGEGHWRHRGRGTGRRVGKISDSKQEV